MDPNASLRVIREIIATYNRGELIDEHELIEHLDGLDGYLSKGGFLPDAWKRPVADETQQLKNEIARLKKGAL